MVNNKQNIFFAKWNHLDFKENINQIKQLRKTYQHYPYLYSYNETEENNYLGSYLEVKDQLDAFVCLVDGELVAISIGCPLISDFAICADVCKSKLNNNSAYYFGDIIVDKQYWGKGIADKLYAKHIAHVKKLGYSKIIALIVERSESDLRKPIGFRQSKLWKNHGFMETNFTVEYPWTTYSHDGTSLANQQHTLRAYEKYL